MDREYYNTYKDEIKTFDNLEEVIKWMVEIKKFDVQKLADNLGVSKKTAKEWKKRVEAKESFIQEADIAETAGKLAKQKQKLQDMNRVNTKIFRENTRLENAVGEFSRELTDILRENDFSKTTKRHKSGGGSKSKMKASAILQLSDVHFNELVTDQMDNKYDFAVASKRLKLYVEQCKMYLKPLGIKNIVFAMTGDMMNSDRRLDELLCQASNRSYAVFLAVDILNQVILDLNKDFNVTVAYVVGNEGRITKDIGWAEAVATDNYDSTMFNMLKIMHKKSKGIDFIVGDPVELVVEVAGQKVLLMHGHGSVSPGANLGNSVQKVFGRYSTKGIKLDYVIMGHIHETYISDYFGRNASLVGSNAYGDRKLGCISRASQNMYIFYTDGRRDGIKIDLQNVDHITGYNIDESLAAYNAKSGDKIVEHKTIFEIRI
jgi:predicted phosphodiesterase